MRVSRTNIFTVLFVCSYFSQNVKSWREILDISLATFFLFQLAHLYFPWLLSTRNDSSRKHLIFVSTIFRMEIFQPPLRPQKQQNDYFASSFTTCVFFFFFLVQPFNCIPTLAHPKGTQTFYAQLMMNEENLFSFSTPIF